MKYCKLVLISLVLVFWTLSVHSGNGPYSGNGYGYGPYGYGPYDQTSSDNETSDSSCLSAIASQNPVLVLNACDLLIAGGDGEKKQVRYEEGTGDGEMTKERNQNPQGPGG